MTTETLEDYLSGEYHQDMDDIREPTNISQTAVAAELDKRLQARAKQPAADGIATDAPEKSENTK